VSDLLIINSIPKEGFGQLLLWPVYIVRIKVAAIEKDEVDCLTKAYFRLQNTISDKAYIRSYLNIDDYMVQRIEAYGKSKNITPETIENWSEEQNRNVKLNGSYMNKAIILQDGYNNEILPIVLDRDLTKIVDSKEFDTLIPHQPYKNKYNDSDLSEIVKDWVLNNDASVKINELGEMIESLDSINSNVVSIKPYYYTEKSIKGYYRQINFAEFQPDLPEVGYLYVRAGISGGYTVIDCRVQTQGIEYDLSWAFLLPVTEYLNNNSVIVDSKQLSLYKLRWRTPYLEELYTKNIDNFSGINNLMDLRYLRELRYFINEYTTCMFQSMKPLLDYQGKSEHDVRMKAMDFKRKYKCELLNNDAIHDIYMRFDNDKNIDTKDMIMKLLFCKDPFSDEYIDMEREFKDIITIYSKVNRPSHNSFMLDTNLNRRSDHDILRDANKIRNEIVLLVAKLKWGRINNE